MNLELIRIDLSKFPDLRSLLHHFADSNEEEIEEKAEFQPDDEFG